MAPALTNERPRDSALLLSHRPLRSLLIKETHHFGSGTLGPSAVIEK